MPVFDVTCWNSYTGKVTWSVTQEALSAPLAIAQACLPVSLRAAFIAEVDDFGLSDGMTVVHPAPDMGDYCVEATLWLL